MAKIQNRSSSTLPITIDPRYRVERFTVDSTILSDKYVTLVDTPTTADKVKVSVNNGPEQVYGPDFIVNSDRVEWDGRGIETGLVLGNVLIVTYVL